MAHGLIRTGEKRILPPARRHPFGIGGSGGGDPGGGYSPSPSGNGEVLLEDFEDQDISDYTGDNSLITDWTIGSLYPYEGSYCLHTRNPMDALMYKTDPSVQRTDWLHCWIRTPSWTGVPFVWMGFLFGVQDDLNYYLANVEFESDRLVLEKYVAGEKTELGAVEITYPASTYKRLEVLWGSVGDIEIRFAGVNIEQTDTTYEDGGWGFKSLTAAETFPARWDYLRQNLDYVE